MRIISAKLIASLIVLLLTSLFSVRAQQSANWDSQNSKYIQISSDGIHFSPRDAKEGSVDATCTIHFPSGQPWKVAFDVQVVPTANGNMSIHLSQGKTELCWLGADDYFKYLSGFLGTGGTNMSFDQPWDNNWHSFAYESDGKVLSLWHNGNKCGETALSGTPDTLKLQNDGMEMSVRNIHFEALPVAHTSNSYIPFYSVVLAPQDTSIVCQTGQSLQLPGTFAMSRDYDTCTFLADGSIESQRGPMLGTDKYNFNWIARNAGQHILEIVYTMQPRGRVVARKISVFVYNTPPVIFRDLPRSATVDSPVSVTSIDPASFPLSRVDFYFRDQYVGTAHAAPFSITLPITSLAASGSYPIKFVARDMRGNIYNSPISSIDIPDRVHVVIPSEVDEQKEGDTISANCNLLTGIQVTKVTYWVAHPSEDDWTQVSEISGAPFTTSFTMSDYESGNYHIKAKAISPIGIAYDSPVLTFTFKNIPKDDQLAKAAKAQADLDAQIAKQKADDDAKQAALDHIKSEEAANLQEFKPRPGFDEQIFRHQLARLAYCQPENRTGLVGTVNGLSVIVTKNGDGDILDEQGSTLTISALVRPGTGQFHFLAFSEEDAKLSAEQASEYCKMKTSGFHWDWTKYDITLGFDNNSIKLGGPSAGLADAVAIMSAAMVKPVDTTVAMTGAITLQGQVQPVGGYDYKALAAFSLPNIHTLIVPADTVASDTLFSLYTQHPEICFNRRVVMVENIDEALRQSIIGWQNNDYLTEEKLIRGGLVHFGEGKDALALAAFDAASAIDPANWTISFWKTILKLTEEQSRRDAAGRQAGGTFDTPSESTVNSH